MPPLFTSTTLTTLVRKVLTAAKQVHPVAPRATQAAAQPHPLHRARLIVQRLAHQTFPSLSAPSHHLGYVLEPVRLNSRSLPRKGPVSNRFLSSPTSPFRTSYRPPFGAARGPAMASNVGIGSARTFASGPTQTLVQSKVPIGFRAFVNIFDDEKPEHRLSRPSRYRAYAKSSSRLRRSEQILRLRRADKAHARRASIASATSYASVDSARTSERSHYFRLRSPLRSQVAVPLLPPTPEMLVTPGKAALLSIALDHSLQDLLESTIEVPYEAAELGRSVFAEILRGVVPFEQALGAHTYRFVMPLLLKLSSLGVLRQSADYYPLVELFAADPFDILHLKFYNRSAADVRAILGESLKDREHWWWLEELDAETINPQQHPELDHVQMQQMAEGWEDAAAVEPIAATSADIATGRSTVGSELAVTPSLGRPVEVILPSPAEDAGHTGDPATPPALSGASTPVTPYDTSSDYTSEGITDSRGDFSASDYSSFGGSSGYRSQGSLSAPTQWLSPPSQEDLDIEGGTEDASARANAVATAAQKELDESEMWEDARPSRSSESVFDAGVSFGSGFN